MCDLLGRSAAFLESNSDHASAAMCGHMVSVLDGLSISDAIEQVNDSLASRISKVFITSAREPLLSAPIFNSLLRSLFRVENLDFDRKNGVGGVRFAFLIDADALSPGEAGPILPESAKGLLRFCTVDWYEGWSDEALARSVNVAGQNALAAMGLLALKTVTDEGVSSCQLLSLLLTDSHTDNLFVSPFLSPFNTRNICQPSPLPYSPIIISLTMTAGQMVEESATCGDHWSTRRWMILKRMQTTMHP